MRDKAAKAAYDRARRARLYVDKRPTVCTLPGCNRPLVQARTSVRLYCSDDHRLAAFYERHPGYEASRDRDYHVTHPEARGPMPMPYVGDPVFEAARKAAHITGDYSVDWGQNDIIGEAVLAILEGRDPEEAVRRHRAGVKRDEAIKVYGVADVGWDGKRVIVQWNHDALEGAT